MRIFRFFTLLLFLFGSAVSVSAQQQIDPRAPSTFAFLHISNIHQTASGSDQPLKSLANATYNMPIRPSFVVATGSVTKSGSNAEYERLKQCLAPFREPKIEVYAIPGTEDTRWVADGKRRFAKQMGKTYQSFDYEGAHFILLDTTVRLSEFAHLDRAELEWLGRDLKRVKPETPILLFLSHPIGLETAETRPLDNEYDLFPLLKEKNVVAIFTSNGNRDQVWQTHGFTVLSLRGFASGSYHRVTVSPVLVTIERETRGSAKPETLAQIAVKGQKARSKMRAGWSDPDVPYLERRRPAVVLEPRAFEDTTEGETGEYRIDGGLWQPLQRGARDIWTETFRTKPLSIGMHTATVKITTSNRAVLEEELIFEVERRNNEPTRKWAIDLKDAIQSSPVLSQNRLFVSCLDGRIYALDRANGKTKWSYKTEGEIVGSPAIEGDTVYVGSTDGSLYALESDSGRLKWKFDLGSPVVSTPVIAKGIVCVGGEGSIVGVNQESGAKAWGYPAQGFFQSRPCTDGANFYLVGWDNAVYAVDVATGKLNWRTEMALPPMSLPTFALSSPVIAQGRLFVCASDGYLRAFETSMGKEIWKTRANGAGDGFTTSSPAVQGTTLYVASLLGNIYAFDITTGNTLWFTPTEQPVEQSSVRLSPEGNSLAVVGVRGRISVLETRSGKRLWLYELGPGNVLSTPEFDGKVVYIGTMANDVQAIYGAGEAAPIVPEKPQKRN